MRNGLSAFLTPGTAALCAILVLVACSGLPPAGPAAHPAEPSPPPVPAPTPPYILQPPADKPGKPAASQDCSQLREAAVR